MDRAPKVAGGRVPREFFGRVNLRDAFSHSPDCDEWFSRICDLPGGEPHRGCMCWCHQSTIDRNEPPEYVAMDNICTPCQKGEHLDCEHPLVCDCRCNDGELNGDT